MADDDLDEMLFGGRPATPAKRRLALNDPMDSTDVPPPPPLLEEMTVGTVDDAPWPTKH
jgi:hypothetical protein